MKAKRKSYQDKMVAKADKLFFKNMGKRISAKAWGLHGGTRKGW